jgi:hypothetical protein
MTAPQALTIPLLVAGSGAVIVTGRDGSGRVAQHLRRFLFEGLCDKRSSTRFSKGAPGSL